MPTFYDPVSDADEAAQALRGLAHASRSFDHPQDLYGVLGDLLSGVRSLRQVLDQLATAHTDQRSRAFDDAGDPDAGDRFALAAGDGLHQSATLIDQAEDHLDQAMTAAGRIAWHENPAPEPPERVAAAESGRRWISVVFLQGEDADRVLDLIDTDGEDAALTHLTGWDYGEETTGAAMENGHVYDEIPTNPLDRMVADGEYRMTYSPAFGHVALYRQHTVAPEDRLDPPEPDLAEPSRPGPGRGGPARDPEAARHTTAGVSRGREGSWFAHPGVSAVRHDRGLGL